MYSYLTENKNQKIIILSFLSNSDLFYFINILQIKSNVFFNKEKVEKLIPSPKSLAAAI